MAFVSATAAASAFATLLISVPSAARAGAGAGVCPLPRRPILAPLCAVKGSNSVPVELESKVKGKKKKGSGAGNLPGALEVEIREAQEYLDSDQQEPIPENFPFEILDEDAFREEITIDDMLIVEKTEDDGEEKFPYEGPEFTELPVNVQKGLFKYLEQRGITLSATNYMHDYMVTKQAQEYIRWMTKLKDFVRQ
ncbi:hypothetical protein BAE44_0019795 [Dichanthelium oligosanthes]|uniref:Uncharacterized protein n=1 Tax=Dichanthelium oligosanthes TaxID=888268 RepID=A0A1E5V213_9POAL|nr:hypothetical protein BAE44_0019795 [Dichanthelium oligosanthes]